MLSKSDVERTVPYFTDRDITVIGIIENMVDGDGLTYNYNKIVSIDKIDQLNSDEVYLQNKKRFDNAVSTIENANLKEVEQENKIKTIFDESLTWKDVYRMQGLQYSDGSDIFRKGMGHKDLKFINLTTWEQVHEIAENYQYRTSYPFGTSLKDPLSEATYERVERLVNVFKETDRALFFITKNPNTEIPTMVGEIAECTLFMNTKVHNLPCVKYYTAKGDVILFPHEVMPVTDKIMQDAIRDGYGYIEDGKRFVPPYSVAKEYSTTFGALIGMPETEEKFDELYYSIVRNNKLRTS